MYSRMTSSYPKDKVTKHFSQTRYFLVYEAATLIFDDVGPLINLIAHHVMQPLQGIGSGVDRRVLVRWARAVAHGEARDLIIRVGKEDDGLPVAGPQRLLLGDLYPMPGSWKDPAC